MRSNLARLIGLLVFVTAVFSQSSSGPGTTTTQSNTIPARVMPVLTMGAPFGQMVAGAPYSAEEVSEHTQTLNDGTHIAQQTSMVRTFRDSSGRTRTERTFGPLRAGAPIMIEIFDPVAGVHYHLDPNNHIAIRNNYTPPPPRSGAPAQAVITAPAQAPIAVASPAQVGGVIGGIIESMPMPSAGTQVFMSSGAKPEISVEALGTRAMNGVMAEGRRHTLTFAVGTVGNDRPISNIVEEWTSSELKITLLKKQSDPRSGEETTTVQNLSRAEPDASLFQPPSDYEIQDAPGLPNPRVIKR